jgi:hypothetical protein
MMSKYIKIFLALILLLCLAKMPYGYYQFVRFISLIGFGLLAIKAHEDGKNTELLIYISLAILFQPFIKISLGRSLWNIVDLVIAIALIVSLSVKQDSNKTSKL